MALDTETDLENQQRQSLIEPEKKNIFECGICYCEYNLSDNEVELKFLDKCGHTFCSLCFEEYYRSMIEDQNKHHGLRCP